MADYVLSASLELQDKFTAKIKNAFKNSENLKKKFIELEERIKKFEKKFDSDKVKDGFKNATKSAENFNNSLKKIDNNNSLDRVGKKIDKITNKIDSSVSKIANKTGKILKWGVVGGTGLGIGALKVGADFETLKARMVTAFEGNKKLAEEHFIWGNKFANDTPFSNSEVLDAMIKLKAYGYKDPRRLMTLLGDFAAGNQRSLDDAVEAYADAANNQFFRMTGFGLKRETVLDYAKNVLKDPIPMNGKEVANFDRFMKVLEIMMQERTKDGMKNAMKTLNGMVSTTTGILKSSVGKMVGVTEDGHIRAGSLMDRVKEKFERFNTYMESPEGQKALDRWSKSFDDSLPQIIKLADTIKDKFKEIAGENFIEKLNNSIANFDPSKFNTALDRIQEKMDFLMDTALRIGGALAGSKLGPLGTITGFFTPEIIDAKNMVEEMKDDPNGEKAEKYKRTAGGGFFLKLMKHDEIIRQIQEQQDTILIESIQSIRDKQKTHQSITNNISINIDGAITNKDDKVAYLDIANQLRDEIQKTIDKSFENMTTEIEFS